jgi:hypothetical protein
VKRSRSFVRVVSALSACAVLQGAAIPSALAVDSTATQNAEQLGNKAYELHKAGKDAEAIATYLKAYEVSKAGVILYNVATIYDRSLHERSLAAEYFRRYLRAPDAEPDLVRKATERLETLKKEADAEAEARANPPVPPLSGSAAAPAASAPAPSTAASGAPPGAEATSHGPLRTVGLVTGIVGVVSLGVGVGFGLAAKAKNDDADKVCNGPACTTQSGVTAAHDAGTFATISTATFIPGAVLIGAGVAMVIAGGSSAPAQTGHVTVTPQVGTTGGGLSLRGSF